MESGSLFSECLGTHCWIFVYIIPCFFHSPHKSTISISFTFSHSSICSKFTFISVVNLLVLFKVVSSSISICAFSRYSFTRFHVFKFTGFHVYGFSLYNFIRFDCQWLNILMMYCKNFIFTWTLENMEPEKHEINMGKKYAWIYRVILYKGHKECDLLFKTSFTNRYLNFWGNSAVKLFNILNITEVLIPDTFSSFMDHKNKTYVSTHQK